MNTTANRPAWRGRFAQLCLSLVLALALIACSSKTNNNSSSNTTSTDPLAAAAQAFADFLGTVMVFSDYGPRISTSFLDAGSTNADIPDKDTFTTPGTTLTLGTPVTGASVPANGVGAVYNFVLAADQRVTIRAGALYSDVTLNDSTKTRLRQLINQGFFAVGLGTGGSTVFRTTLDLKAGTYYVYANNPGSFIDTLDLSVANGTADTSTPLNPGISDPRMALIPGSTNRYYFAATLSDGTDSFSIDNLVGALIDEGGTTMLHGNQRQHNTSFFSEHDIGQGTSPGEQYFVGLDDVQGKNITAATVSVTGDIEIRNFSDVLQTSPVSLACNPFPGGTNCSFNSMFMQVVAPATSAPTGTVTVVSTYPTGTETQTFTISPSDFLSGGTVTTTSTTGSATVTWSGWPTSGLITHFAVADACSASCATEDTQQDGTISGSGSLTAALIGATTYEGEKGMESVVAEDYYTDLFKFASDTIGTGVSAFSLTGGRAGERRGPAFRFNPLRH